MIDEPQQMAREHDHLYRFDCLDLDGPVYWSG
jgi:hypothetical protein